MTAVGQGGNSNEGLYGPLPFPDSLEYISMIYSFFLNDLENNDPRYDGKSYCLLVVTFPKKFEPYYANRHYLSKIFDSFLRNYNKLQDIDKNSIDELKLKLIK